MRRYILPVSVILLYVVVTCLIIACAFSAFKQTLTISIINTSLTIVVAIAAAATSFFAFRSNRIAQKATEMQAKLYTTKIELNKRAVTARIFLDKKSQVRFQVDAYIYTARFVQSF